MFQQNHRDQELSAHRSGGNRIKEKKELALLAYRCFPQVNKKFAREYDERKRKEALSKSKKFLDDQESVSTEEDETAELISDHVEAKSAEQQCSDQQQVR